MTFKKGDIPWNKMNISKVEMERRHTVMKTAKGYFRKYSRRLRAKVLIKLGDKCVLCGFTDPRALHIDHVFNDGFIERKQIPNQSTRMRKALNDTEGRYQILCANCNVIKRHELLMEKLGEI